MTESPHPREPFAVPNAPPEAEDADLLAFTPVPLGRIQHNGWSPQRQRNFIAALAAMGSVLHAARAVGMTKQSAYNLRSRPGAESFAAAWNLALHMGYDEMFGHAMDRALNGVVTPRFYRGKQVGMRRSFDYRLAFAALNGSPPPPLRPRNKVAR
ncbi:hypothetical protein ACMGDH_08560 [Sphingomonas sp. DT-207]|uniref:hypothetical protein n=1 Tax=Sphingomonas sp. DT-207 TaxID=3396167 RepID=UPI003F1C7A3E